MIKFNKTQHGMTNWKKQDQKIKKNKNKKNKWSLKKAMEYKKKPSTCPKTSPHT